MGFDSWDMYNVGEHNMFPGPIDNSGLFSGAVSVAFLFSLLTLCFDSTAGRAGDGGRRKCLQWKQQESLGRLLGLGNVTGRKEPRLLGSLGSQERGPCRQVQGVSPVGAATTIAPLVAGLVGTLMRV